MKNGVCDYRVINQANLFKLEVRNIQYDMMSRVCAVDQLTGVWNRYAMQFKLTQEHERVSRHDESTPRGITYRAASSPSAASGCANTTPCSATAARSS